MQLISLSIERARWGKNKGQFVGEISFDNELGMVAIKLTPEKCEQLFMVCAEGIVDTAKEAAKGLACSVIEHEAAIAKAKGEA